MAFQFLFYSILIVSSDLCNIQALSMRANDKRNHFFRFQHMRFFFVSSCTSLSFSVSLFLSISICHWQYGQSVFLLPTIPYFICRPFLLLFSWPFSPSLYCISKARFFLLPLIVLSFTSQLNFLWCSLNENSVK